MRVAGLLLAAGRGARMGRPKALVHDADGRPWLAVARRALSDGGCAEVLVVLGARAAEAAALFPDLDHIVAADWADGMGASLRAGLRALADRDEPVGPPDPGRAGYDAALIHLVDIPDVDADVVRRVLEATAAAGPGVLARATYDGEPGHPVLIGRDHWAALVTGLDGDIGARDYLASHHVVAVECGDLATGCDVDTPDAF